jgi:hypothetical protein
MLSEAKHLAIAGKAPYRIESTYTSLARSFAAAQDDRIRARAPHKTRSRTHAHLSACEPCIQVGFDESVVGQMGVVAYHVIDLLCLTRGKALGGIERADVVH